jgi:hypothetical protein
MNFTIKSALAPDVLYLLRDLKQFQERARRLLK